MILTNFEIHPGYKSERYLKNQTLGDYVFSDIKTENPVFKISPQDTFEELKSVKTKETYGDWKVYSENGIFRKLQNGTMSFFSDINPINNVLIYRIKTKKFGKFIQNNKYSYVIHIIEIGNYTYFFIKFAYSDYINLDFFDKKGNLIRAVRKYRKKRVLSFSSA